MISLRGVIITVLERIRSLFMPVIARFYGILIKMYFS